MPDQIPRCAVLIPHYRNPAGLQRSLASIGANECVDVFIVDDGSDMPLDEAGLRRSFPASGQLHFICLAHNQGIQYALNAGLAEIGDKYEYVARLDCGDICVADRFTLQVAFLDQHPDIALLGSAVTFMDQQATPQYTLRLPQTAADIRLAMHNNCAFIHPTVMWRHSMAKKLGHYPVDYPMAEDFAFFWRFVQAFATANMPQVLVFAEINPRGLSLARRRQQLYSRLRLQWRYKDGSFATLYGLLKTLLLMLIPYRLVLILKKKRRRV